METDEGQEDDKDNVPGGPKMTTPKWSGIDHFLEDLAKRKNLPVMNVKSILRVSRV